MSYYNTEKLYPWLYSIHDPMDVYMYLIVGEQSAILFDTGYGIASIDETVKKICNKPYTVVLSHGHIDHANGAHQFNEVFLHPGDNKLYLEHTSIDYRRMTAERLSDSDYPAGFNPQEHINAEMNVTKALAIGDVFELGGITAEIVPMEGHTAGSVGLLVREHKVLLCSDAANPHVWMFLDESLPMAAYIKMLKRTKELDFTTFFVGHSNAPRPKSEFEKYIHVAENIDINQSTPYDTFPELGGFIYQEDDIAIVYRPDKLAMTIQERWATDPPPKSYTPEEWDSKMETITKSQENI